jgi:D-glycero-alpha-D-manno-heptose-7-phosphate kinase
MIIVKAPLRISLGGGGTDLPGYYEANGGFVISAAINKFITIVIKKNLKKTFEIKYSKYENVKKLSLIKHNIIREALKLLKFKNGIEISSFSDVPHGTGLGSSGSFTVCLLKALHLYKKIPITNRDLALKAFYIERKILKQPVGLQDHFVAAYGGLLKQIYGKDKIRVSNIKIKENVKKNFEKNLILIYTGLTRNSNVILKRQDYLSSVKNKLVINNLNEIKKIGYKIYKDVVKNNLQNYGKLLDEHWKLKNKINKKISNNKIEKIISICKKNNVIGCRVVGAGGGGYILAFSKNFKKLKKILKQKKILLLPIKIENKGVRIIHSYNYLN